MSQNNDNSDFQDLVQSVLSRRTFIGGGAAFGLGAFATGGLLSACTVDPAKKQTSGFVFKNIASNSLDTVSLPPGFHWYPVASLGDPLSASSDAYNPSEPLGNQPNAFGDVCDGLEIFEVAGATLVVVNHESIELKSLFPGGIEQAKRSNGKLSKQQINDTMEAIGVSVSELQRNSETGQWQINVDSPYNRRINMKTPMAFSGPAKGHALLQTEANPKGQMAAGTWGNCGCGKTPWGTFLTCEENFDDFFKVNDQDLKNNKNLARYGFGAWHMGVDFDQFDERFDCSKHPNEGNRAGYVVEIDPSEPNSVPIKRTALGRFKHENAELVVNEDGRVVVYMGDDEKGEYLYKYVSDDRYQAELGKQNADLLDNGSLYVAKFEAANAMLKGVGRWIELTFGKNGLTVENGFSSQAEICINTRVAASFVGATTMDRPEWVSAHPKRAEVYCALTNNNNRNRKKNSGGDAMPLNGPNPREKNLYGQVLRWYPKNDDHASDSFNWDLFVLAGNPLVHQISANAGSDNITADNMFNSPDGLKFDAGGSLWIQTDGKYSNKGKYKGMGNNQMLIANPDTGEIKRFLVGPSACEVTGAAWSADQKTVFVSIQHPGQGDAASNFPYGGDSPPRSTVIAIEQDSGEKMIARS